MSSQPCMSFFLMLNIKEVFWRMLVIEQLMVHIDFHSISFPLEVNGDQQLFGSSKFFDISSSVFSIRKKLTQVWNNMRVNKQIVIFGWAIPLISINTWWLRKNIDSFLITWKTSKPIYFFKYMFLCTF